MRRLVVGDRARDASALLGRDRAEQARREGRLRRREARRVRRAHARAGVRPLRGLAARARARHRPEDGGAARAAGAAHARRGRRARPRQLLVERFGPNLGRDIGPARALRARRTRRGRRARSSRSRASARSTTTSAIRDALREALARDGERAVREPRRARAARPHDRDQGAPRRLHDRHPRAHACASRRATSGSCASSRCGCSRSTRPPRPVRLLGVRVAGLSSALRRRGRRAGQPPAAASPSAASSRCRCSARSERGVGARAAPRSCDGGLGSRDADRSRRRDRAELRTQRLGAAAAADHGDERHRAALGRAVPARAARGLRRDRLRPPRRGREHAPRRRRHDRADGRGRRRAARRRSRSTPRTCSGSRWGGWSRRSSRCATQSGSARSRSAAPTAAAPGSELTDPAQDGWAARGDDARATASGRCARAGRSTSRRRWPTTPTPTRAFLEIASRRRVAVPVVMAQLRACAAHDTSARLPELALPTLVVHGTEDADPAGRQRPHDRLADPGRAPGDLRGGRPPVLLGAARALRRARARARRRARLSRSACRAAALTVTAAGVRALGRAERRGRRRSCSCTASPRRGATW